MEKFLITRKSYNRITGPIMVTTSPRRTCPVACPYRKSANSRAAGACYAEHGSLGGFIWTKLDQLLAGASFKQGQIRVYTFMELLEAIRALPAGALWRHNQAGDLPTDDGVNINEASLMQVVDADRGRRGFTYTHFDVIENAHNRRVVKAANDNVFTINLSANSGAHADQLKSLDITPVTVVVPQAANDNHPTPDGNPVVICPARKRQDMNCARCGICAKPRTAIIAFPALGRRADAISM